MGFGLAIASILGLCGAALAQYVGLWPALVILVCLVLPLIGRCLLAIGSRPKPQ